MISHWNERGQTQKCVYAIFIFQLGPPIFCVGLLFGCRCCGCWLLSFLPLYFCDFCVWHKSVFFFFDFVHILHVCFDHFSFGCWCSSILPFSRFYSLVIFQLLNFVVYFLALFVICSSLSNSWRPANVNCSRVSEISDLMCMCNVDFSHYAVEHVQMVKYVDDYQYILFWGGEKVKKKTTK